MLLLTFLNQLPKRVGHHHFLAKNLHELKRQQTGLLLDLPNLS